MRKIKALFRASSLKKKDGLQKKTGIFRQVTLKKIKSEVLNLNIKKSSTKGSVSATILIQCVDIYLPFYTNAINNTFVDGYFSKELKKARVIPVYIKDDPLKKGI